MAYLSSQLIQLCILFLYLVTRSAASNTTLGPIIIPGPPGPFATALEFKVMVDVSRSDPFNSSEKSRRILTSVFNPVSKPQCSKICQAQYMPLLTAQVEDKALGSLEPLFERFKLSGLCCDALHRPANETVEAPLLIWSPGFRNSRLEFSTLAQYVASHGYQVVLVDHPGDAFLTQFPDGEVVIGDFSTNATAQQRDFVLNVETQDVLFVANSYANSTSATSNMSGRNLKLGVVAHGAVAAQAMLNDSLNGHPGRISGGVNLDGVFNGPVLTEGLGAGNKSFLLWVPPSGPNNITSWNEWWNITNKLNPGTWRKELSIANSTQGTLTDFPLLADLSGFRKSYPKAVDAALGTINGTRSTNILATYISAFFDMALKGEEEPLLDGPNISYPEVHFVRSDS